MAIVLHTNKSNELRALINVLEEQDVTKRLVSYYGVGEVFINKFISLIPEGQNITASQLQLNKLIDECGELAILDRSLFTSIFNKIFQYHIKRLNTDIIDNLTTAGDFYELVGIGQYYHKDDVTMINRNFEHYRHSIISAQKAIKDIEVFNSKE